MILFGQEQGLPHDLRRRLRSFFLSPGESVISWEQIMDKSWGQLNSWKAAGFSEGLVGQQADEYTVHGCVRSRSEIPPLNRWILRLCVLLVFNQVFSLGHLYGYW